MENEPSTPIQSPPADVNDLSGPGLFSAEKNATTEMDNPQMNEQPELDVSSEKVHVEHDEDEQQETNDGSSPGSLQSQHSNDTTTPATLQTTHQNQPSTAAHTMAPPPIPNFKATPTSAQPAHLTDSDRNQEPPATPTNKNGGSKSRIPTSSKQEKSITRPTNGKRRRDELDQQPQDNIVGDPATEAFNDPSNPLPPFDWTDLESRYHHKMNDYAQQEGEIYRSFHELCDYFAVWAETGHQHEVERSFKRLRTQTTLVRHHEEELETKRQHYVKVVDAFKSALHLLGAGD